MTRSHSKNNTASSVFSYAEYKRLDYGTKKQRLGVDSMRPFSACSLCLGRARDPVACSQGHLYCKECIYTDLLKQKKDIKRYQAKLAELAKEEEAERERVRLAARERVLRDFERSQLGLAARRSELEKEKTAGSTSTAAASTSGEARGVKRKFDFDQETVDRAAKEAEDAALRQIEVEQAEARRAKLPDFWLPSLTPNAPIGPLKDVKLDTLCKASSPAHKLSLKNLIPVLFTVERLPGASNSGSATPDADAPTETKLAQAEDVCICPSCKKTLGNTSVVFVMKLCGHVVCKTCTTELIRPSSQCVVCDGSAKEKEIVELNREGTGYAAGGRAETSLKGISFQG